jgi:hypothetical protein
MMFVLRKGTAVTGYAYPVSAKWQLPVRLKGGELLAADSASLRDSTFDSSAARSRISLPGIRDHVVSGNHAEVVSAVTS